MSTNRNAIQLNAEKLLRQGQIDQAIALYCQVLDASPRDMILKTKIGELYVRAGSIAEAVKTFGEVADYYEGRGFDLKAVAMRSRIRELIEPSHSGPRRAEVRPRPSNVAMPIAAAAARPSRGEVEIHAPAPLELVDDALCARAIEAVVRVRNVDDELRKMEERLAMIEAKRSGTLPHVYDKVRRDAMLKLGALEKVVEACDGELQTVREKVRGEREQLTQRFRKLETDLEELRFLESLGDFTKEEFSARKSGVLADVEAARKRLQLLDLHHADLETVAALRKRRMAGEAAAAASGPTPVSAVAPELEAVAELTAEELPTEDEPGDGPSGGPPLGGAVGMGDAAPYADLSADDPYGDGPRPAPVPHRWGGEPGPAPADAAVEPAPDAAARTGPGRTDAGTAEPSRVERQYAASPGAGAGPREAAVEAGQMVPLPWPTAAPTAGAGTGAGEGAELEFRPVLHVYFRSGAQQRESFPLPGGSSTVGRAAQNHIVLLDQSVSRHHVRFRVEGDACFVEDQGSANGTYVNDERLNPHEPRRLADGDLLQIGVLDTVYRTTVGEPPAAPGAGAGHAAADAPAGEPPEEESTTSAHPLRR